MGISNTIPPSRLIQPGVVANTAARPTSPFTGQAIYQVDTNQMLIWNGTAWVIPNTPAQNPTGLELITTATCSTGGTASNGVITIGSGSSTVVVGSAFSSTYDNYLIQIANTVVSANQPNLGIQLTGTTSGYYYAGFYQSFASATMTGDVTTTGTYFNIGACGNGTAGSGRATMDVVVKSPNVAQATFFSSQNASLIWNNYYNGHMNNTTQYTGFTILPSSGNLTGGTIRVYGYRK